MPSAPTPPGPLRLPGRHLLATTLFAAAASAQGMHLEVGQERPPPSWLALPYVFRTESLETAFGVAGGTSGQLQESTRTFAAVLGSTNDSAAVYLVVSQLRLSERWFVDTLGSVGNFTEMRAYTDPIGAPQSPPSGSNDSSPDQFLLGAGADNWLEARCRYVLPIGDGGREPLAIWRLDDGLLHGTPSGGHGCSPFESGRTVLELRPYWRHQSLDIGNAEGSFDELAVATALEWDNTDYPQNPGHGTFARGTIKQGIAGVRGSDNWTGVEAELAAYLPLGTGAAVRQSVLAFDLWTVDTPSWDDDGSGRSPHIDGARLGGFYRLRGFQSHRFHDRAAIYGAAELRVIPDWNPLRGGFLESLDVDWIQLVGFVEAGRVAPSWRLSELLSDVKWDAGFGLRMMARQTVVRLDVAWSDETYGVWATVGHPFGSR